ncbi:hypothetical protein HDU81_004991 [Chytriomyces hyalinus]|nr:hypothetical protein HDU81_004991 [Chytriomyces hyalinus]
MKFDAHKAKASRQWKAKNTKKAAASTESDRTHASNQQQAQPRPSSRPDVPRTNLESESDSDEFIDSQTENLLQLIQAADEEDAAVGVSFTFAADAVQVDLDYFNEDADESQFFSVDAFALNKALTNIPIHTRLNFDESLLEHDHKWLSEAVVPVDAPPEPLPSEQDSKKHNDADTSAYASLLKSKSVSAAIVPLESKENPAAEPVPVGPSKNTAPSKRAVTKKSSTIPASTVTSNDPMDELDELLSLDSKQESLSAPKKQTDSKRGNAKRSQRNTKNEEDDLKLLDDLLK